MLPIIAAVAALLALCVSAPAQDYPTRPVRIFIPLAAGGGGDVLLRWAYRRALAAPASPRSSCC